MIWWQHWCWYLKKVFIAKISRILSRLSSLKFNVRVKSVAEELGFDLRSIFVIPTLNKDLQLKLITVRSLYPSSLLPLGPCDYEYIPSRYLTLCCATSVFVTRSQLHYCNSSNYKLVLLKCQIVLYLRYHLSNVHMDKLNKLRGRDRICT